MSIYFPFNSAIVNGQPDRAANAETLALYLKTFFTDGVVLHKSAALQVDAKEGLTVQIQPGTAFLDGRIFYNDSTTDLTLDDAEINLDRIDRVIFRIDYVNRLMEFAVLKGEPGSEPVATELQRDADAWEMCLAEVYVEALVTEISQTNITDTRANSDVCGIVVAAITQLDTATFYEQYKAQFEEALTAANTELETFMDESNETFTTFMDELRTWANSQKTTIEGMIADLEAQGFENAAEYTDTTMAAVSWDQNAKTYSFEDIYPSTAYNIFVQPTKPCTAEQLEAWGAAMILGDSSTNVYTALGDVPGVDIPVTVRAVKK